MASALPATTAPVALFVTPLIGTPPVR